MDAHRVAFNTWQEKTEWVQKDKRFDVLLPWGKHRATVLVLLDELEAKDRMVTELLNIISRHTIELGWGEKPITLAELIISREGSGSDALDAIRAAAAGKGE